MWMSPAAHLRDIGTDAPTWRGAPAPSFPIAVHERPNLLAPPPLVDRYPFIVGNQVNLSYVASVFRLCLTGYRSQYVDLLDELLDQDPHLYSVMTKRVQASANGRFEITPCDTDPGSSDEKLAVKAAAMVKREVARIKDLTQSLSALLWAVYRGIGAAELFWTRDSDGWHIERLGFIHSRRLSYPDQQSWSLHIWDQGQVYGWKAPWGASPTNAALFGLKIEDFPGKFIVYAPQLRGDYPTREGVGRQVATWALFKRIGARGAADYLERFVKPLMDVSFTTTDEGKPREATQEDIALAAQIASSIGPGSSNYASHADSITVTPKTAEAGTKVVTYTEWMAFCDAQMSKAALGGTLGTEVGHGGGNRALGETQERGEVNLEQYDATTVSEAFRRDVITWLVRLNMPEALHVIPNCALHVDEEPDPKSVMELVTQATSNGFPVDVDAVAEEIGIPLIENLDKDEAGKAKPRRSYKSDVVDPHTVDDTLMSEQAKAEKDEDKENQQAVELAKANQPKVLPGGLPAPGAPVVAKTAAPGGKATKTVPGKGQAPKPAAGKGKPPAKKKLSDKPGEASIVIVRDSLGNVLTVSRPEPPNEMAIPGGEVDEGETPMDAAMRELREETGITVLALERVTLNRSVGGWAFLSPEGTRVHVFKATEWEGNAAPMEPDTRVEWLSVRELREQASLYQGHVDLLIEAGAFADASFDLEADQRDTIALLLDDKAKSVPREVFDQLLEDYPAKVLPWVLAAKWSDPQEVPTSDLDFTDVASWRASHEPIQPYIDRINAAKGRKPAGVNKPVILVKVPGEDKLIIVDGHHRVLACKEMGVPVLAYVATVHHDAPDAPWRTLHADQRSGSSRGSFGSFVNAA
jgi:8-oxo-dGTP diphosphatase